MHFVCLLVTPGHIESEHDLRLVRLMKSSCEVSEVLSFSMSIIITLGIASCGREKGVPDSYFFFNILMSVLNK